MSKNPRYLGVKTTHPIEELDSFPAPDGIGEISMTSDEVTGVCPVTGQPDYYTVTIAYLPNRFCIESKSLKLYLWSFRDKPAFCEQMAVDIRKQVEATIAPKSVTVTIIQKPRGGITIEASSSSASPKKPA